MLEKFVFEIWGFFGPPGLAWRSLGRLTPMKRMALMEACSCLILTDPLTKSPAYVLKWDHKNALESIMQGSKRPYQAP